MADRKRTVNLKGKEFALAGAEITVGQKAPDFKLIATNSSEVDLSHSRGKVRLLSVVHSLDTEVCNLQTQRFEQEAANFEGIVIYAISMDLPFAQARYCGTHDIGKLKTLSDHQTASFGRAYGVLIEELRLLSNEVIGNDDGVALFESSNNIIARNIIRDNVTGVRVYGRINGSSENLFEDNEISGSANYGIFMYDAAVGNTFSSNQVISNGDSGIYLKSVFDNLFSDNEVSNNEFGLRLDSTESKTLSSGNQFKNNIVQGNHYGLYSYPPPDSNIFENNRITDNGANVTYLDPQPSGRSLLEIARLTLFGLIITVALITAIVFIVRWQRQQPPPGGRRI